MVSRTTNKIGFKKNRPGKLLGFTDIPTSKRMSGVRRNDTAAELLVRQIAYALGLRYRITNKDLVGSPDLANRTRLWAVFVHGCFWHRHEGCVRTTTPTRNRQFWLTKFATNVRRDRRATDTLRKLGWRVVVIWECQSEAQIRARLRRLM